MSDVCTSNTNEWQYYVALGNNVNDVNWQYVNGAISMCTLVDHNVKQRQIFCS